MQTGRVIFFPMVLRTKTASPRQLQLPMAQAEQLSYITRALIALPAIICRDGSGKKKLVLLIEMDTYLLPFGVHRWAVMSVIATELNTGFRVRLHGYSLTDMASTFALQPAASPVMRQERNSTRPFSHCLRHPQRASRQLRGHVLESSRKAGRRIGAGDPWRCWSGESVAAPASGGLALRRRPTSHSTGRQCSALASSAAPRPGAP